jgi:hypothetical protein
VLIEVRTIMVLFIFDVGKYNLLCSCNTVWLWGALGDRALVNSEPSQDSPQVRQQRGSYLVYSFRSTSEGISNKKRNVMMILYRVLEP